MYHRLNILINVACPAFRVHPEFQGPHAKPQNSIPRASSHRKVPDRSRTSDVDDFGLSLMIPTRNCSKPNLPKKNKFCLCRQIRKLGLSGTTEASKLQHGSQALTAMDESLVLGLWTCLFAVLSLLIWCTVGLVYNIRLAQATGLPFVILPFSLLGAPWQLAQFIVIPLRS